MLTVMDWKMYLLVVLLETRDNCIYKKVKESL